MATRIPEKLNDFAVYVEGQSVMLGMASVELPDLKSMTEETSGAGIAGKVANPVVGHFDSMTLKLTWRTVTSNVTALAAPKIQALDMRGAIQSTNATDGLVEFTGLKIVARGMPVNTDLGKFETGKMMNNTTDLELHYLKISINGEAVIELDKYNHIFTVHGTDYLGDVRGILGLGQ